MNLIINKFTNFYIEKISEDKKSITFKIEIHNKYFNYTDEIQMLQTELLETLYYIDKLLKGKLQKREVIFFKKSKTMMNFFPIVYNNRSIIDWDFTIRNDEDMVVSCYSLTFERTDIISLQRFLYKFAEDNQEDLKLIYSKTIGVEDFLKD